MLIYLLFFLVLIPLQVWLSRRKSRLPGLILPILHFLLSILLLLSIAAYSFVGDVSMTVTATYEEGINVPTETVEEETVEAIEAVPDQSPSAAIGIIGGADGPTAIFVTGAPNVSTVLPLFLLFNVPTTIYILIYIFMRIRLKHRKNVNKTLIQDL